MAFDLDDLDLSKKEPLKENPWVPLYLPTKFGEDRPKDLGGVGKQTHNQTLIVIGLSWQRGINHSIITLAKSCRFIWGRVTTPNKYRPDITPTAIIGYFKLG